MKKLYLVVCAVVAIGLWGAPAKPVGHLPEAGPSYQEGSLKAVSVVLEKYMDALKLIYTSRLETDPDLRCRLAFEICVSDTGAVDSVWCVESTTPDTEFVSQIQAVLRAIKFPFHHKVCMTWPIIFSSDVEK
jgi:hypothetical protein